MHRQRKFLWIDALTLGAIIAMSCQVVASAAPSPPQTADGEKAIAPRQEKPSADSPAQKSAAPNAGEAQEKSAKPKAKSNSDPNGDSPKSDKSAEAEKAGEPAKKNPLPRPNPPSSPRSKLQDKVPGNVEDLSELQKRFQTVVEKSLPAVVGVRLGASSGSAVVISPDGLVLSAAHVCGEAGRAVQFLFANGKSARGVTLGLNKSVDAGMMKITDPGEWPYAPMAELGSLKLGDWVVGLGHPGGFLRDRPPVVRVGRVLSVRGATLQTDCSLVGGDSGGPLFDLNGHVVGIHSRIGAQNTNNYHVSIDTYWNEWDRLSSSESYGVAFWQPQPPPRSPNPPVLGVAWTDTTDGPKIESLSANRPAAKAGLQVGDLLRKFDGEAVKDQSAVQKLLEKCKADQEVALEITRGDENLTIKVKLEVIQLPQAKKKN